MKIKTIIITVCAIGAMVIYSCKKDKNNSTTPTSSVTSSQILADFTTHVAQADYSDLNSHAQSFSAAAAGFNASPNNNDLASMRIHWFGMRKAYECGEAFLIGPISTQNLDPHIDSWPVEQQQLDSILSSSTTFNQAYINSLPTTLKGFHPIEYLIFGRTNAAAFTARQTAYLQALTADLVAVIAQINNSYNTGASGNYANVLTAIPNSTYGSRKAALLDLVNAMSSICDEVGGNVSDGKIYSVYSTQDTLLQESLFSRNSWVDFKNNITGVLNVYTATYGGNTAGNSLSSFVSNRNLSLNNTILTSINNAIGAFNGAHQNFSQSVFTERTQCVAIMNAIDSLRSTIDNKLVPFINQYVTD